MAKVKVELNTANIRKYILQSEEVADYVEDIAKERALRCGEGYATSKYKGRNRVNVSVYAETSEAKSDNYANNTLLKIVGV